MSVPPADRRACPAERQAAISPSHAAFVARLAAAGFAVTDEADADRYWHLLLARTTDR